MSTSNPDNTSGVVMTTKGLKLSKEKKDSAGADANKGKVAIMSVEPHLSLIPQVESSQDAGPISDIGNCGSNLVTSSYDVDRGAWLLDSGAIDHMTFATTDFTTTSPLRHTSIANANGVVSPVIGFSSKLQVLRSDNGAERKHRHILETTRYWSDAVSTVVHLLNRLPSKVLNFKTLLQVLASHVSLPATIMLHPRATLCTRRAIGAMIPLPDAPIETMVDEALSLVLIDPTRLDGPTEQNTTLENYTPSATELSSPPSLVYADPFLENIPEEIIQTSQTFVHVLSSSQIPTGVQEALFNPKWTQAIKEEIEALLKNNTWTIVSLPEGKKAVGCK
ncbi:hypothetical protein CK203_100530 [Vitis vinifera]|uniref:Retrovirus-related Pol polyprotein from transposon RE2 n=1 Tax=Vitis vinifera TaxID=29760 RepID=A0A438E367_VITVI|nr:hypothetical protein CK203_100530 [Vitis vinifera]